jgi:circadian clock protein KaiC
MTAGTPPQPERVPTGVAGLDRILQGGFRRGGIYFIAGRSGTGKTVLGNQICFNHVAAGGRAVYVTLLAETHAHLLDKLRSLRFFSRDVVGDALYYISAASDFDAQGYQGLLDLLRTTVRQRQATVLVIDGLPSEAESGAGILSFQRFLQKLQVTMEAHGCTSFVLEHLMNGAPLHPAYPMADGIIHLTNERRGLHAVRELEVFKFRGSSYLEGRHLLQITAAGLVVYPRTEQVLAGATPDSPEQRVHRGWGIPRLDEMTSGGPLSGSTTMLLGSPGSGKTLLGLHFLLEGARQEQPGLYFGFYEMPSRLIEKAQRVGLDLQSAVDHGMIEIIWQPALGTILDLLAERLLAAVYRRSVQRLFIDGIDGLRQTTDFPERIDGFLTALTNELRTYNVTTLASLELHRLFGPAVDVPLDGLSAIAENLIFLRYVELRSQIYRLISIIKMRDSDHDMAIREFTISGTGIEVAETFESAEAILTGIARPLPPMIDPQSSEQADGTAT